MNFSYFLVPTNRCLFTLVLACLFLVKPATAAYAMAIFCLFLPLFAISKQRLLTPVTVSLAFSIGIGLVLASPIALVLLDTLLGFNLRMRMGGAGDFLEEFYLIYVLGSGFIWTMIQSFIFIAYGFRSRQSRYLMGYCLLGFLTGGVAFMLFPFYGVFQAIHAMRDLARVRTKARTEEKPGASIESGKKPQGC